ncbi:MAG: hypothetical protein DRQ58_10800, partial [Gammaproteobacteria bacterium]
MLSDMKVFNQYITQAAIETLAQMVDKFNAASAGAIQLTTTGFDGDYLQQSFWASIHSAQRRVDRYAAQSAASATDLSQLQHNTVKVAGAIGPVQFEASQLTWMQKNPDEAIEMASRNMAEAIMQDQLNTGIASAVAAIGAVATATAGQATHFEYVDLNASHALFGDHSSMIVADVMDGAAY